MFLEFSKFFITYFGLVLRLIVVNRKIMLKRDLRLEVSHIFCLKILIFLCIRYCYCIVDVGSGGIASFLYYMIFFCWVIGVVRSGSARTLYLDGESAVG